MRIAMVAPFGIYPKGTTRWRVLPLARALAVQGHLVRVAIPSFDWPQHGGRCWTDHGVDVTCVDGSLRPRALGYGKIPRHLVRAVLAWQPDVVHCFKPKAFSGLAATLLALLQPDLPVVVDTDDWEAGWNDHAGYPRLLQRFFAWQEQSGLCRAQAVTAASHWLRGFAIRQRQDSRAVFYLPNGAEATGPERLPAQPGRGKTALLYTRFVEHTPDHVWDVWRKVGDGNSEARLLVAGKGRAGEEHGLAELARRRGVAKSVQLLGWVPAPTRPGLFSACDVAFLPVADTPLARAKSPMRLVDLLAAGIPTATQAVGEYATYVRDGDSGLLAAPGDTDALADAVLRLLQDYRLRHRIGQGAMLRIRNEFMWERLAGIALTAYEAVLGH